MEMLMDAEWVRFVRLPDILITKLLPAANARFGCRLRAGEDTIIHGGISWTMLYLPGDATPAEHDQTSEVLNRFFRSLQEHS